MKKVMTIAGSDSSGGAGVQADLKTFAALKVYGLTAITAVTAQNTVEVSDIHVVPADFVSKQIQTVARDIEINALKTGMLSNADIIEAVAAAIKDLSIDNVVVDPVMISTSGDALMGDRIERMLWAFRKILFPVAKLITPNIPEAEILTGREILTIDDAKEAAKALHQLGASNVVIKGGHLQGEDDAVDVLFDGSNFIEYRSSRIVTKNSHGTGCTFSAALAAYLAKGLNINDAVGQAKDFVRMALINGFSIGHGSGPTNHFGEIYRRIEGDFKC